MDIDDILGGGSEKPRKKNSGRKGRRVERELADILNRRFGGGFSRSVGSGNRWGQVSALPKHARDVYSGDLVCPENFAFVIESKGGYDMDVLALLTARNKLVDTFLKQAVDEAARSGRKPLLAWKQDRRPWMAFIRNEDVGQGYEKCLRYGDWTGVPLTVFLEEPDEYFFVS